MTLDRRRRIFRGSGAVASVGSLGGGVGRTAAIGLLGAIGGAAIVLMSVPQKLLGSVPTIDAVVTSQGNDVAVVDGNTLLLRQMVVRLKGIAVPARGQTCRRADGSGFDCGAASVSALAAMVRGTTVSCHVHGRDAAGLPEAQCDAGGASLNHALVADGWARAEDAPFSADETQARDQRRGLWRDLAKADF